MWVFVHSGLGVAQRAANPKAFAYAHTGYSVVAEYDEGSQPHAPPNRHPRPRSGTHKPRNLIYSALCRNQKHSLVLTWILGRGRV